MVLKTNLTQVGFKINIFFHKHIPTLNVKKIILSKRCFELSFLLPILLLLLSSMKMCMFEYFYSTKKHIDLRWQ